MDPAPRSSSENTTPSESGTGGEPGSRSRARVIGARIAIVLAILVLVLVATDYVTSRPGLCGSCHEMGPRYASWAKSGHAAVVCVSCHQSPTSWYALPRRLIARAGLLGRDTWWHFTGRSADGTDDDEPPTALVSNKNCLQCHDPNRQATSGFRILINHVEHAEMNETCLSCHVNTAHPEETRGRALSLMDQCFACHGTAEVPEASAACGLCHPVDFELLPASHKDAKWKSGEHGQVAIQDRPQCAMCHKEIFCTGCHGLEMPHPENWARGQPAEHATVAERNRRVCARCHKEKPDLCSMCHHRGWEPKRGPWIAQHPLMVRQRGAAFCMECHTATFCPDCHIARRGLASPALQ